MVTSGYVLLDDVSGVSQIKSMLLTPTTTGTIFDCQLETEWTMGTLINADFSQGTTLSGSINGIVFDLGTNLTATGYSVTGESFILPAVTNTGSDTYYYQGLTIAGGAIVQNTNAGTNLWLGVSITMPNITQTTGTITSYGLDIIGGVVTSGTAVGAYINMNATTDTAINVNQGISKFGSQTQLLAGQIVNITTVNAATYDLLISDYILSVTYTSTAAVTSLTLPTAQMVDGRIIYVKDAGGNAAQYNITIDTEGAELIDGENTFVIDVNYGAVGLYSDGANWFVL